ncbi:MAG: hypothetical protein JXB85_07220 [Anaerolineales bacterium]|nr:hypothetical protein [Anaerolineales bacterium]
MLGRARRLRVTQIGNNTTLDPNRLHANNRRLLSKLILPLIQHRPFKGAQVVKHFDKGPISDLDMPMVEIAAELRDSSWDRAATHRRLTDFLQAAVSLSPTLGTQPVIERAPSLSDTVAVIQNRQEYGESRGYLPGLAGNAIPLLARIFAVADAFDVPNGECPYRTRNSDQEAPEYLHSQSDVRFDPQIVSSLECVAISGRKKAL